MNASVCIVCVCTYGCEAVGVLHECVTVYLCVCLCVFGCETVSVGMLYEHVSVCLCVYVCPKECTFNLGRASLVAQIVKNLPAMQET